MDLRLELETLYRKKASNGDNEILNDAVVKLLKAEEKITSTDKLEHLLNKAIKQCRIDRWKRGKKINPVDEEMQDIVAFDSNLSDVLTLTNNYENVEVHDKFDTLQHDIHDRINGNLKTDNQRDLFNRFFVHGEKQITIAKDLGVSKAAISKTLTKISGKIGRMGISEIYDLSVLNPGKVDPRSKNVDRYNDRQIHGDCLEPSELSTIPISSHAPQKKPVTTPLPDRYNVADINPVYIKSQDGIKSPLLNINLIPVAREIKVNYVKYSHSMPIGDIEREYERILFDLLVPETNVYPMKSQAQYRKFKRRSPVGHMINRHHVTLASGRRVEVKRIVPIWDCNRPLLP